MMRARNDLWTQSFAWTKASLLGRRTAWSVEAHSEVRDASSQESNTQQTAHNLNGSIDRCIAVYLLSAGEPSHRGEPRPRRQRLVGPNRMPHQDGPSLSVAGG